MTEKQSYADKVSREIIEAIENGTAPWMKPWKGIELINSRPHNALTGNHYNGINSLRLSLNAFVNNYVDPRWCTYKQAAELGGQVRKGEKSVTIQYVKLFEEIDKKDENGNPIYDTDGKKEKEIIKLESPKIFFANVFNAEQIDNFPKLEINEEQFKKDFNPNETAETILKNSGAVIEHKLGSKALYDPTEDKITLPQKEQFVCEAGYYSTALHELSHWTGHETRLNRDLYNIFGTQNYAKEELRAEISSYMLSQRIGIDFDPSNHYSYIDSWLEVLKKDKYEIFRASKDAEKISDYVIDLGVTKEMKKDIEVSLKEVIKIQDEKHGTQDFPLLITKTDTYLYVPYTEKEKAKEAGAKWDKLNKAWIAPRGIEISKIEQWIPKTRLEKLKTEQGTTLHYASSFKDELLKRGWDIKGELVEDGNFHRVSIPGDKGSEKSGSYVIHNDGRPLLLLGDFRAGTIEKIILDPTPENYQAGAEKEQIKEMQELNRIQIIQNQKNLVEKQAKVAKALEEEYKTLPQATTHSYLVKKGIEPTEDIKIDTKGNLVIPFVSKDKKITTVQRIYIAENGNTIKMWEKESLKQGSSHIIKGDMTGDARTIVVCEGFATGASINQATKFTVYVAGDATNIKNVAENLAIGGFAERIIIAADNDQYRNTNENKGLIKAQEAKDYIIEKYPQMKDKIEIAKPIFTNEEQSLKLTDFNDLHQSRGKEAVAYTINGAVQRIIAKEAMKKQNEQPHNKTQAKEQMKETKKEVVKEKAQGMER